jgi:hypothetical protein
VDTFLSKASAPLVGATRVPGDKSISHRAILFSALARGRSVTRGANLGADVLATCAAVRAFGVAVEVGESNHTVEVESSGWGSLTEPEDAKVIQIRDTLHLAEMRISEAYLRETPEPPFDILGDPEEMRFDGQGTLADV